MQFLSQCESMCNCLNRFVLEIHSATCRGVEQRTNQAANSAQFPTGQPVLDVRIVLQQMLVHALSRIKQRLPNQVSRKCLAMGFDQKSVKVGCTFHHSDIGVNGQTTPP